MTVYQFPQGFTTEFSKLIKSSRHSFCDSYSASLGAYKLSTSVVLHDTTTTKSHLNTPLLDLQGFLLCNILYKE